MIKVWPRRVKNDKSMTKERFKGCKSGQREYRRVKVWQGGLRRAKYSEQVLGRGKCGQGETYDQGELRYPPPNDPFPADFYLKGNK